MKKIAAILCVRWTILKRDSRQRPSTLLALCAIAIGTLLLGFVTESAHGKAFCVVFFACAYFFLFGMAGEVIRLSHVKIYPLSDRMVFVLLWATEFVDFSLAILVVYSLWLILLLYPDYSFIYFYLTCMGMSYVLIRAVAINANLLNSVFSPSSNVCRWTASILSFACLPVWAFVSRMVSFSAAYEFVSHWRFPIMLSAVFVLIALCKTGTVLVSRYSR